MCTCEDIKTVRDNACFGEYQPEGACLDCYYRTLCEAETIARDAYWDQCSSIHELAREMEDETYGYVE